MCEICVNNLHVNKQAHTYDPTRTMTIRNMFARKMRVRFDKVRREINDAIVDKDVFGLNDTPTVQARRRQFDFPTNDKKVSEFMEWLNELIEDNIITVTQTVSGEGRWTDMYVEDTYKRGVIRARQEMKNGGMNIPNVEQSGGIEAAMTPVHMERVRVLYLRVFEELKGITSQMATQISRVLSQGLMDGDNPRRLATKLNYVITGMGENLGTTDTLGRFIPARRRSELLARTEIIRAHHKGMIQEFRNYGVQDVHVLAELRTAGDARVCDVCQGLEGATYTLDEAENLIPVHPLCRCIVIPVINEFLRTAQIRGVNI